MLSTTHFDFIFSLKQPPNTEYEEVKKVKENSTLVGQIQSNPSALPQAPSIINLTHVLNLPHFLFFSQLKGIICGAKEKKNHHPRSDNPGRVPGILQPYLPIEMLRVEKINPR